MSERPLLPNLKEEDAEPLVFAYTLVRLIARLGYTGQMKADVRHLINILTTSGVDLNDAPTQRVVSTAEKFLKTLDRYRDLPPPPPSPS